MDFIDFLILTKAFHIFILLVILIGIALLHFYWAFGGKWGFNKSIPYNNEGKPLFVPTTFQCITVGIGLLLMIGFIILWGYQEIASSFTHPIHPKSKYYYFHPWVYKSVFFILAFIFTLRAIGDFNYVGFFKKVKNTSFGKLDSMFYSPLCLLIGGIFFWIAMNT